MKIKYLSLMAMSLMVASQISFAKSIACPATYQDKQWIQVTIWHGYDSDSGTAECLYRKDPNDQNEELTRYHFPKEEEYYRVSGIWKSGGMPFDAIYCEFQDGNKVDDCRFAKRETQ